MREEDAVQYTTMKHKNGRGYAKDVNCDANADPSAPGGAISGGVEMEHIRLKDLVQQHHALDTHNNTQHILPVAMLARIILCMTEVVLRNLFLLDLDGRMQSLGWKNQQCNNNRMRLSHRAIGFFIFVSGERYDLIDRKAGK